MIIDAKSLPFIETDKRIMALAFDNSTASRKWRFEGVAERFNLEGKHEMYIASHNQWNSDIVGANIVVLEMLTGPHIVDECKAQGAKVIYEADDAVIDTYGQERKNLQHLGPKFRANAIETIKRCDAITVTNYILAENYARFTNKPIYILPNYIDFDFWYGKEPLRIERNTNEIRIGFFGSRGHYEDLRMIVKPLKKVLEKYPQARFIYCGYGGMSSDKLLTEVGWGEDVFREIPRSRREFVISVPYDHWPMKHRLLDFDIGIAPLVDDYFNHCKTAIKWMEYSALRIPSVVSPVVFTESPFGKDRSPVVKHQKTALVARSEEEWVKWLSTLIENKELRLKIGKDAQKEVIKEWDLARHFQDWEKVYLTVLNS